MNFQIIPKQNAHCELCGTNEDEQRISSGWDFEYETSFEEFTFVRCARCGLIYL